MYYRNTDLQPPDLRAYIVENGQYIHTGRKPGTYDEEGLISGQKVTVAVTGSVDPNKMKHYRQVTLSYLAIGGDQQNPSLVAIRCS